MTSQEFKDKITTDVDYYLSFLVENNLPAINQNLVNMGIITGPTSKENAFDLLSKIWNRGEVGNLEKIINVPYNSEAVNGTEEWNGELAEIYAERTGEQTIQQDTLDANIFSMIEQMLIANQASSAAAESSDTPSDANASAGSMAKATPEFLKLFMWVFGIVILLSLLIVIIKAL